MRNLALAFGLVLFFAVTAMAAPPQPSSCKITTSFTAKGCSAAERKLIQTTQAGRPTTKQVNIGLARLAAKEYLVINTICDLKGGRRKVARRLVEKCYDRVSEGQRLILRNAINNLQDIKACKGLKRLGQQVNCMIDQDNKLLLPLIERTLDAHETHMKGLKFMIDHGCNLKGGKLKCANSVGLVFAAILMFLLGRLRPQLRIVIGIVAMIIGMVTAAKAEPCVNQAWRLSNASEMLQCEMVLSTPESNLKHTLAALNKAQHEICAAVPSAEMMQCFDLHYEAAKIFKERVGLLILKGYQKIADDMYPRPLSPCPGSFSKELCASVQWPQEAGTSGLVLLILFYALMGWVGRVRSVLIIVVAAIGCLAASVAEGACTAGEAAINDVAAQYGLVRYDCDDVPQAFKDAVFDVIWRGFVAKGGLKMGMSKSYIRSRWKRAEGAFWKVWSDAPLWQARIAAAICTKEYLCGVTIKFSDWDDFRFESPVNNDGTIDCGITQINSNSTSYSCDELQNLETAFKEQKRIIMLKVRGSSSKKVWKKRIHRYNHKTNYEYGKVIWDWSGASFGWFAILMGLFRRRQGQGDVGLAREEGDWQKRAYPVPKWGGHNEDPFQWVPEEEPSPTHCPGCGQEGGACFSIVCGAVYSPDSDED